SGGTYVFLREGFGRETWGRFLAFLFIWQFILSGPMEIGSGFIGMKQYLGFLFGDMHPALMHAVIIALGLGLFVLLYRQITSIARITTSLWIGIMLTVGAVIFSGIAHFNPRIAFDFPPGAFNFSLGFLMGL